MRLCLNPRLTCSLLLRFSLMAAGLLFVTSVANGCHKSNPVPADLKQQMKEQMQLTAANTNRSVFNAPLHPVELKRTHLADAVSNAEGAKQTLNEYMKATDASPWTAEVEPFLHSSGDVVIGLEALFGGGLPDPQNEDAWNKFSFEQVIPLRLVSFSPSGELLAEVDNKTIYADTVKPDPYHDSAMLLLSPTPEEIQSAKNKDFLNSNYVPPEPKCVVTGIDCEGNATESKAIPGVISNTWSVPGGYVSISWKTEDGSEYNHSLERFNSAFQEESTTSLGKTRDRDAGTPELWRRSPAADNGGNVYLVHSHQFLQAIDSDGHSKWKLDVGVAIRNPASLLDDGSLMLVGDNTLQVSPDEHKTTKSTRDSYRAMLMEDTEGPVKAMLVKISPDGEVLWKLKLSARWTSELAVSHDGVSYLLVDQTSLENNDVQFECVLTAITPNGSVAWTRTIRSGTGLNQNEKVQVDGRGNIVVCTDSDDLYCFDSNGKEMWHLAPDKLDAEAFVILPGNRLFVYGGGDAVILGEGKVTDAAQLSATGQDEGKGQTDSGKKRVEWGD